MKQTNLKTTILCMAIGLMSGTVTKSQVYSGTWMKGSAIPDQSGVYGNIGVAANANTPGGRDGGVQWKDASGNFWLFGGYAYDHSGNSDIMNDLWKYNPATNQWAFMKGDSVVTQAPVYGTLGVAAAGNRPGGRSGACSWTDANGNFWLFGGYGYDSGLNSGEMNDLWKYTVSTNEWTWMGGSNTYGDVGAYGTLGVPASTNIPGSRVFSYSWTDASGNLWLFGGAGNSGANYGTLQDLWKYDPTTNNWTWVNGSANTDVSGVYGTMGSPAGTNLPGSRWAGSTWKDSGGDLWLFGGSGYDAATGSEDGLNDLWKYNISSNQWTWVKGSNVSGASGVYGTLNTPANTNAPGGRIACNSWVDATGVFYLFGGQGYDAVGNMDFQNDLWKYSTSTNQWTWMKGSSFSYTNGVYGTKGVPSVNNVPGSRVSASNWIDANNNLWLFGGFGMDSTLSNGGEMNDLWKLETCVAPTLTVAASSASSCPNEVVTLTVTGAATYSWSTTNTVSVISVTPANTSTYLVIGVTSTGCSNSKTYTQTMLPMGTVNISASNTTACLFSTITLTASGASTYTWNNGTVSNNISITPTLTGFLSPTCTPGGPNACYSPVTITINVVANPTVNASSSQPVICKGESAVLTASGAVSYSWDTTPVSNTSSVSVSPQQTTTYSVTGTDANGCVNSFTVSQVVNACTGFSKLSADAYQVSIYPNPSNGIFNISISDKAENLHLNVVNALGQVVLQQELSSSTSQIDSQLSKGVYYYQIVRGSEKVAAGKFLVE